LLETKALKYMLLGLLLDVALVLAALLVLAVLAAVDYDGLCGLGIFFGSGRSPCSRSEYVYETVTLVSLLVVSVGWWIILPLLLLPPFAGFLIGLRRPSEPPPLR
jgi:hypothetical protein